MYTCESVINNETTTDQENLRCLRKGGRKEGRMEEKKGGKEEIEKEKKGGFLLLFFLLCLCETFLEGYSRK